MMKQKDELEKALKEKSLVIPIVYYEQYHTACIHVCIGI